MKLRPLLLMLSILPLVNINAQKAERVHGEYTYHVPENISLEEGKRTALHRAKIQALADAFGAIVSQSNTTIVTNENGKSSTDLYSLGGSDVKGEWIETLGEPKYEVSYESGMLVINVEVEGKVREIRSAGVELDIKVLRNGTEPKFESEDFKDGDDLYLYFKSPVDGCLAVYLLDEVTQYVFCMLPYKGSSTSAYRIKQDQPYVFFSAQAAKENPAEVDEYIMTCKHSVEQNTIYVVFSTNMFAKTFTVDENAELSGQLSLRDFQKWLGTLRTKDSSIQVINKSLKITQK